MSAPDRTRGRLPSLSVVGLKSVGLLLAALSGPFVSPAFRVVDPGAGLLFSQAQDSASGSEAPPVPIDAGAAEITRAIRAAKKALDAAQAAEEKASRDRQSRIAEETKAVLELGEEKARLEESLRSLAAESVAADRKAADVMAAHGTIASSLAEVRTELQSQVARLKDRLTGTLVAAQDEQLVDGLNLLHQNPERSLPEQLKVILELYGRILGYARSAVLVQLPLRLADSGDRIEELKVLRLGMLGGFYSRPSTRSGGFVLPESGGRAGFVARSAGLSELQEVRIAAFLQQPEKGGWLAADVTGGAGITLLAARETPQAWFRRGGFWMWPLLVLGALALIVALERVSVLLFRNATLPRQIQRVLSFARSQRIESALAESARLKGGAGQVLQAVLLQEGRDIGTMRAAAEEALHRSAPSFRARLGFLSLAAAVAPLLGFLGTIAGLTGTFKVLTALGYQNPVSLSSGLSEALIATQMGLFIAIPCLLFRGFAGALAEKAFGRIEAGALALMIVLQRPGEPAPEDVEPLEVGDRA
ncbi:MAG TPA: DUF3450 family protein [Planctomycetota bacterium]|nr:DUF3450 family protein [Planctomycetota bacterium]